MSATLEEQILSMQFDNAQFESGVKTSISTLDKLKSALNLDKAADSLTNVGKAASSMALEGIAESLSTISNKFTVIGTVGDQVIRELTSKVLGLANSMGNLANSMSFEQIGAGWQKYGEKTTSVATLVAQGYAIEDVNEQLNRLNWFTDETSYNFTDMVSNISKFTASGQDLETSVTAMEGIASWAALSGQNATVASRAMYQLSQAMSKGALRYDDWRSIQTANMDTQEFRQQAILAAEAIGALKQRADGTYEVFEKQADGAYKTLSKYFTATELFTSDALTRTQWLNSDVMMKTFNQYSAAIGQLYEYAEEHGVTASEAMEELGDQLDEFGLKAFKAGQEARTWADVVDSVKDAVSTGWMNTFEALIGNAEEATKVWTWWANNLFDVFMVGTDLRNDTLTMWREAGGSEKVMWGIANAWDGLGTVMDAVISKLKIVFFGTADNDELILKFARNLVKLSETFLEWTDNLQFSGREIVKIGRVVGNIGKVFKAFGETISTGFGYALSFMGQVGELLSTSFVQVFGELSDMDVSGILDFFSAVGDALQNLQILDSTSEMLYQLFEQMFDVARRAGLAIGSVAESAVKYLPDVLNIGRNLLNLGISVASMAVRLGDNIATAFSKAFKMISPMLPAFQDVYMKILNVATSLRLWVNSIGKSEKSVNTLATILTRFGTVAVRFGETAYTAFEKVAEIVIAVREPLKNAFAAIGESFPSGSNVASTFVSWLAQLRDAISGIDANGVANSIGSAVQNVGTTVGRAAGLVWSAITRIKVIFTEVAGVASEAFKEIFPSDTSGTHILSNISNIFQTLRERIDSFQISSEQLDSIKSIFRGLFAVVDLGKTVFAAFFESIQPLFSSKLGAGGAFSSIVTLAGKFGEFLVSIRDSAKNSDLFKNIFDTLVSGIQTAAGIIGPAISKIADWIGKLIDLVSPAVDWIVSHASGFASSIKSIFDAIRNDSAENDASSIGSAFSNFAGAVKDLFSAIDWSSVSTFLTSTLTVILNGLSDFVRGLTNIVGGITENATAFGAGGLFGIITYVLTNFVDFVKKKLSDNSIVNTIKGILDSVTDTLDTMQTKLKADTLKSIAVSIGIIAASIAVLSLLKPANIAAALGAITASTAELFGYTVLLGKMKIDSNGLMKIGFAVAELAIGLLIMASAVKKLGGLDPSALKRGVIALGSILAMITVMTKVLPKSMDGKSLSKLGTSIIKMGVGMLIIAKAVTMLANLNADQLEAGLVGLSVIVAAIAGISVVASSLADNSTGISKIGTSIIKMAAGMLIMAEAVSIIGSLNSTQLQNGLTGFVTVFAAIELFLPTAAAFASQSSDISKIGTSIIKLSAGVLLMANAITMIGSLGSDQIISGMVGLATVFSVLAGTLAVASVLSKNADGISKISAAILTMSVGIFVIAGAIKSLGSLSLGQVAKGLLGLIGGLAAMAIVMKLLSGTAVSGGAQGVANAILTMSVAMIALGVALKLVGSMTFDQVITALVGLAGAIAVVAVASGLVTPILPAIEGLSNAMLKMGASILVASAGLALLALAVQMLAPIVDVAVETLLVALGGIITGIAGLGAEIASAITTVVLAIVEAIVTCAPAIVSAVVAVLAAVLEALIVLTPLAVETVLTIIDAILVGLAEGMPKLINSGINLMIAFVNGLAEGIRGNQGAVLAAIGNLLSSIAELLLGFLQSVLGEIPGIGGKITDALETAKGSVHSYFETWGEEAAADGANVMESASDGFNSSAGGFFNPDTSVQMMTGVRSAIPDAEDAGGDLGSALAAAAQNGITSNPLDASTMLRPESREKFYSEGSANGAIYRRGVAEETGQVGADADLAFLTKGTDAASTAAANDSSAYSSTLLSGLTSLDMSNVDVSGAIDPTSLLSMASETGSESGTELTSMLSGSILSGSEEVSTAATDTIGSAMDAANTKAEEASDIGKTFDVKMASGISSHVSQPRSAARSAASSSATAAREKSTEFYNAGSYFAQGMADGITDYSYLAEQAAAAMGQAASNALNKAIDSNSPSKVTTESGGFFGEGFSIGIESWMGAVADRASVLGSTATEAMRSTVEKIRNIVDGIVEVDPTIRPVLDLSNVTAGVSAINSTFAGFNPTVSSTIARSAFAATPGADQNGINSSTAVVQAINSLREDVNHLGEDLSNMQMVLDTGAFVGATYKQYDQKFGAVTASRRRSN